jgi:cytochrome c oxidase assembly factor CtaG
MVQHMLLLGVVPPLILLGEPVRMGLDLLPVAGARALLRVLRRRPLALAMTPLAAASVFAVVVCVTHVPAVFDAALRSEPLHALEHLAFLSAGLLLWSVALGADPGARALPAVTAVALLTAAMAPMTAVGIFLATATHVVYAPYEARAGLHAALAEQDPAATAMWAGGLPFAAGIVLVGWAALRREERRQRSREAAAVHIGRRT